MYRLKDLTSQCEFTNVDEVKFLFLIHNKHSEVKQELLKCVTEDTTLGQCLQYTCNIEGNLKSFELSKYVEKAQLSVSATKVHAVDKRKIKPKRCDVTPARQNSGSCDEKPKCDKWGLMHKPKKYPAFGK